mgnify:CR=1 FL=1
MKSVLIISTLLLSLSALAETSSQVIRNIEIDREATCHYDNSTNRYCFNGICNRWKNYTCEPDDTYEPSFKVRLRVKTKSVTITDPLTGMRREEQVGPETVTSTTFR